MGTRQFEQMDSVESQEEVDNIKDILSRCEVFVASGDAVDDREYENHFKVVSNLGSSPKKLTEAFDRPGDLYAIYNPLRYIEIPKDKILVVCVGRSKFGDKLAFSLMLDKGDNYVPSNPMDQKFTGDIKRLNEVHLRYRSDPSLFVSVLIEEHGSPEDKDLLSSGRLEFDELFSKNVNS